MFASALPLRAQTTIAIEASRTAGVAPLAVFFDVADALPWSDVESSEIRWDFGDGSGFNGFLAAHVYELDDASPARDYTVRVEVERNGSLVATGQVTVSVTPFAGTTLCVSDVGDFTGCPAGGLQRTSLHDAWGELTSGSRLLLRRGETWQLDRPLHGAVDGPVTIGAFGPDHLPRPHLDRSEASVRIRRDWRLLDLEITGPRERLNGEALVTSSQADHQLFLRVKGNDLPNQFAYPSQSFFFIESEIDGGAAYGHFMGGHDPASGERLSRFAVLGSTIRDNDEEHCIRTHGSKVLIADNHIHSKAGSILKIAGTSGTHDLASLYVLIANNHLVRSPTSFAWAVGVGPENTSVEQYIDRAILDGNVLSNSDPDDRAAVTVITADDVTVRNNVFLNSDSALLMLGDTNRPHPHSVRTRIYNNTFSSTYPYFTLFRATQHNLGIYLRNNLIYATPSLELHLGKILRYEGPMTEIDSDHNLFLVPGAASEFDVAGNSYLLEDWQTASGNDGQSRRLAAGDIGGLFVDLDGADGIRGTVDDDLHLASDSVAIDAGAALPLAHDHDLQPRPVGATLDVGAFERRAALFADGFESGNTSAWSAVIPSQ
ncbi:MAG: hypothetical protein MPN21_01265 [Thermoanaerobaculia bacterium]|nr:hypothetical protein [Thermoanaerobaculia bacterium]